MVVGVERVVKHRLLGIGVKRTSRLVAHDEGNALVVGDFVRLRQCRPLSKTKHWAVVELVTPAGPPSTQPAILRRRDAYPAKKQIKRP